MDSQRWELKLTVKGGHRYFLDRTSKRIAVADDSGRYPDETDDRELYLNPAQAIFIRNGTGVIPVLNRYGEECIVTESQQDAIHVGLTFNHRTLLEVVSGA
jgi:hypothetical protein